MRPSFVNPCRAAALVGFAVAVAAGSSPAIQSPPPREINSLATQMSPRISQCLIRRHPGMIDRWLRTLPGSAAERRLVRAAEPRFPACFGEPYGVNGAVWLPKYDTPGMRAALVRALLQARRGDLPASPPAGDVPAWYSAPSGPPQTTEDRAAIVAAGLGACLAARHWDEAVAIVRAVDPEAENSIAWGYRETKAARDREAASVDEALSKVMPSISACVPAGAKIRINRLRLRSLLEEAAYQLTNAGYAPAG